MFFLRCFCPVWVLVRVFQKMQKISTLGRLSVLMIKIRKSVEKDWKSFDFQSKLFGGDKRDRTADLMTASHALSQLSYTPIGGIILSDLFGNCKSFFRIFEKNLRRRAEAMYGRRFRAAGGRGPRRKTGCRDQLLCSRSRRAGALFRTRRRPPQRRGRTARGRRSSCLEPLPRRAGAREAFSGR